MSFVLGINVVSEPRKRSRADAGVMRWFDSVETNDLYISVLVIGEIRQGIEGLRRRDPDQAGRLESWLAGLRRGYADRILPVDLEAAEERGRMNVPDPLSTRDGLMAATAKVGKHDLRHPQHLGRRAYRRAAAQPVREFRLGALPVATRVATGARRCEGADMPAF